MHERPCRKPAISPLLSTRDWAEFKVVCGDNSKSKVVLVIQVMSPKKLVIHIAGCEIELDIGWAGFEELCMSSFVENRYFASA